MTTSYVPPKIWTWDNTTDSASGNRPTAGARFEQTLPVGTHPLQLYSLATPNGQKVTILLEELLAAGVSDAEYDAWLINIGKGDQFGSGFVEINPNSKIPALVDHSQTPALPIFESGAILLYLAEKFGRFIPTDVAGRQRCLSWLFWQIGAAPYAGGGFGHFYVYAQDKQPYPIDRFTMEVKRQLDLLDQQLARTEYIAGNDYTLADIAIWPWYGGIATGATYNAVEFLQAGDYKNLLRWQQQIAERPAVKRGQRVNSPGNGIAERHSASDLDGLEPTS